NLIARSRKIQSEVGEVAAEIVAVEDQLLGQFPLVSPDDPADPWIDQAILVSRRVDGFDAGESEIPNEFGLEERGDEASAGGIDMDGNVQALLCLELVEGFAEFLDVLVAAVEGAAHD